MNLAARLKGVGIALLLLFLGMPVAVGITLLTSSFWSWVEHKFEVEAYGHSGPAEWCYLVTYGVVISLGTVAWSLARRRAPASG